MKLFTPEQIIEKTRESLRYSIQEKQREQLILTGQLETLQTTLANLEYLIKIEKE